MAASPGIGLMSVSAGALGQDAALDHPRQHPLAVGLVAVVELPAYLSMYSSGAWCGAWLAPGQNHRYQGFFGARRLAVGDEGDRLVGEVLREVVAVLGEVRLVDVVVVLDQVGYQLLVSPPMKP